MPTLREAYTRHRKHFLTTEEPEDAPNVIIAKLRAALGEALAIRALQRTGQLPSDEMGMRQLAQKFAFGEGYTLASLPEMEQRIRSLSTRLQELMGTEIVVPLLTGPTTEIMTHSNLPPEFFPAIQTAAVKLADIIYREATSYGDNPNQGVDLIIQRAREKGVQNIDPLDTLADAARVSGIDLGASLRDQILPAFFRRLSRDLAKASPASHVPIDHTSRKPEDYTSGATPTQTKITPKK